jgi:regulatory protein
MNEEHNVTGRITEIRAQVRDPERVSLFVDDEFRMGLPRVLVAERNLKVGQTLTDSELEELESLDEASRATNQAIRLLSYRPRSHNELRSRLKKNGFQNPAIDAAIDRLSELGYVNDQEFAAYWVENRKEHRPRGRRLLASELRSRGIAPEIADRAIDDAGIDEFTQALELAQKRSERMSGLEPIVWRRRMAGFLQRRGYGWDVVRPVLEAIERERDESDG